MSLKVYLGGPHDGEPRSTTLELLSSGLSTTSGGDASGDIKCSSLSIPGCSCSCQCCCSELPYMLNGITAASDECSNGITCCSCSRRHRARRNGFLSIRRRRNGFLSIRRRRNGILATEEGQEGSWDGTAAYAASGATGKRPTSSFGNPIPESLDGAGVPGCCCCCTCCSRGGGISDGDEDEDGAKPASGNTTPLGSARGSGRGPQIFSDGVTMCSEHGGFYSPTMFGGSAGTRPLTVQRPPMTQQLLPVLYNDTQQGEGGAAIAVECDATANSRVTMAKKDAQQMQPQQLQLQPPQFPGAGAGEGGIDGQMPAACERVQPPQREHSPLQTPREQSQPLRELQQRQQQQQQQRKQQKQQQLLQPKQEQKRPGRQDSWHPVAPGISETVPSSTTPTIAFVDLTSRSDVQLHDTYVVPGSCVSSPVVRPYPPVGPCTSGRSLTQLQQPQPQQPQPQRQLQQPPPSPRPHQQQQQQEQPQQHEPGRASQGCQLGEGTGSAAVDAVEPSRGRHLKVVQLRSADVDNVGAVGSGRVEPGQSELPSPSPCSPRPPSRDQQEGKAAAIEEEGEEGKGKVAPCTQGAVRQPAGAATAAVATAVSASNPVRSAVAGAAAATTPSSRASGALRPGASGWLSGAPPGVAGKTQTPPPLQLSSATASMGTSPGPATGPPVPQENTPSRAATMVTNPAGSSAAPSYTPGFGKKLMPSLSQCEHLSYVESGSAFATAAATTGMNGAPCRSPAARTVVTTMVGAATLGKMPYRVPPRRARSLATLAAVDRTALRTNHLRQFLVTGQQVTHGSLLPLLPSPIHSVAVDWSSGDTTYTGIHSPMGRPRRSVSTQMSVGYHTAMEAAAGSAVQPPHPVQHPQQQHQVSGVRLQSSPLPGVTGISNLASGLPVRSWVGSGPASRRPLHWSNTLTSALSDVEDGTEGDEDEDTPNRPSHWQRPGAGVGTGVGTGVGAAGLSPCHRSGLGVSDATGAAAAAVLDTAALVAIDLCDGVSAPASMSDSHPEQHVQPRQAPPSPSLPPPLSQQQQQVAIGTGLAAALPLKSVARALSSPETINGYGCVSTTANLLMGPTAAGGSPFCPPDTSVVAAAATATATAAGVVAPLMPAKPLSPSIPPALLPPTGAPQRRPLSNDTAAGTAAAAVASLTALVSRPSLVSGSRDSGSGGLVAPCTQQDSAVTGSKWPPGSLQHNSWPVRRGHDSGSGGSGRVLGELTQPMVGSATAVAAIGMHNAYTASAMPPTPPPQQAPQQHLRVAPSPPSQRDSTAGQGVRLGRMMQPLRQSMRASGGGEGRGPPPPVLSVADAPLRSDDGDGGGDARCGGGDVTALALSPSASTYGSSERVVKQRRAGSGQAAAVAVTAPLSSPVLTPRRELHSSSISLPRILTTSSSASPSDPGAE
ncbi:hypothetical protein Vafri_16416 [Volvox africanus]|uniref:Uncharacterized protein n=1 Tax=Volvox africanus TaxID=51714 RepID=A0A8J4BI87_9CHLO|nr:hypothetical protein Vafri_16416 [Volvox africanus]